MTRALVLLSGGVDSAVALWWASERWNEVLALTFRYPGRPQREAAAARELARRAGVARHLEVDLPFVEEAESPPGYVPARNALFYAAATHVALREGCGVVVGGHNAEDGARFPDATPSWFRDLETVLRRGLAEPRGPRLFMPLVSLRKRAVVAMGARLGVPLELAWSCYEDVEEPCGACPACAERARSPLPEAADAASP